jgi:hypothetical protein
VGEGKEETTTLKLLERRGRTVARLGLRFAARARSVLRGVGLGAAAALAVEARLSGLGAWGRRSALGPSAGGASGLGLLASWRGAAKCGQEGERALQRGLARRGAGWQSSSGGCVRVQQREMKGIPRASKERGREAGRADF